MEVNQVQNHLRLIFGLLPASRLKNFILDRSGNDWHVHKTARVRPVVFWHVHELDISEGASIGSYNIFRDLRKVRVASGASIGQLNWFSAASRIFVCAVYDEYRSLILDEESAVTSRHFLDCSGGITIGKRSTFAGVRSVAITHGPDFVNGRMEAAPIRIGEFCFIGASVTVLKGVQIVDRVVVAAGSVVSHSLEGRESLYAGVPATMRKALVDADYFSREGRRIDPNSTRPVVGS